MYDVTTSLVNNIAQYTYCLVSHKGNRTMNFGQLREYNKRTIKRTKIIQKMR